MTWRVGKIFVFGLVLLIVVAECMGIYVPGVDIVFFLFVGWIAFISRVLPQVQMRWDAVASAVIYSVILIAGSHFFLRWLCRESSPPDQPRKWRWSWTFGGFAIVLLMFTAGMAAIGIAHQTAWLVTSKVPIYREGDLVSRVNCAMNLRVIGQAILLWSDSHNGRLPDDLGELLRGEDLVPEYFICPSSEDQPASGQTKAEQADHLLQPGTCSYIYLGKGLVEPVDPARAIAVEPLENHNDKGMNVLFGDGHVEWVERDSAESLLLSLGFRRVP